MIYTCGTAGTIARFLHPSRAPVQLSAQRVDASRAQSSSRRSPGFTSGVEHPGHTVVRPGRPPSSAAARSNHRDQLTAGRSNKCAHDGDQLLSGGRGRLAPPQMVPLVSDLTSAFLPIIRRAGGNMSGTSDPPTHHPSRAIAGQQRSLQNRPVDAPLHLRLWAARESAHWSNVRGDAEPLPRYLVPSSPRPGESSSAATVPTVRPTTRAFTTCNSLVVTSLRGARAHFVLIIASSAFTCAWSASQRGAFELCFPLIRWTGNTRIDE